MEDARSIQIVIQSLIKIILAFVEADNSWR